MDNRFQRILHLLMAGKKLRRKIWKKDTYIRYDDDIMFSLVDTQENTQVHFWFNEEDFINFDWEEYQDGI